jgi:2,3-dihydroxybenzoate-AMP ligase
MSLKPPDLLPGFTPWPEEFAERYRAAGYWTSTSLGQMLRNSSERFGERTALVGSSRRVSYAALDRRADELCEGFASLGVRARDRVIVQLPNEPEFVEVCFALFRLGAIPVFALPSHRLNELRAFALATQAVAYVTSDAKSGYDYPALARRLREAAPHLQHLIVSGDTEDLIELSSLARPAISREEPDSSEAALLQLSGGSTSVPKLIPRTHADYLYSVRRSAEICRLDETCVYLCALPAAHNFPFSSPGILGVLHAGGTVVFAPRPSPDAAFELIRREGVTMTALVPPLVALWLQAAATRRASLASLRVLQVGGAKLGAELARRVEPELGARLQQVYGMAEGLVCYTRFDDPEELVLETQGRPMCPDDELRIVDSNGNDVPEGEPGELWTRGPYTIRGYYDAEGTHRASFSSDGHYRTGDVVRRLPSGHLVVEGRIKDLINRGGEKVSAEEIEGHLLAHPDITDAIVVAAPDRYLGEIACAFVIRTRDDLTTKQVLDFLRARELASYKLPDRMRFIAEFPSTGVGKVHRRTLRERLAAELERENTARAMGPAPST